MHDPRVLLDPATDAVRRLARRGYALDVTALEKLLSARNAAIHRGDEARAESKRTATVGAVGVARRAARAGRAGARAEERRRGRRGRGARARRAAAGPAAGHPEPARRRRPGRQQRGRRRADPHLGRAGRRSTSPRATTSTSASSSGILDLAARDEAVGPAVRGAARARARSWSGRWPATSSTSPRSTATPSSRCRRWSTGRR